MDDVPDIIALFDKIEAKFDTKFEHLLKDFKSDGNIH